MAAPADPPPHPPSMARVRAVWDWYFAWTKATGRDRIMDSELMRDLELVDAQPAGRVVFRYRIPQYLANLNGDLHGGGTALLFDMCTMAALGPIQRPGFWEFVGGVTRSLNVSYLKGIRVGTDVLIDATVVHAGKTVALVRGDIKSPDGKVTYATCEHHKINIPVSDEMRRHEVKPRL